LQNNAQWVRCLAVSSATASRLASDNATFMSSISPYLPDLPTGIKSIPFTMLALAAMALYFFSSRQTVVVRSNPYRARVVGRIPGRPSESRYHRYGRHRGAYKHRWKSSAQMLAMDDGSVLYKAPPGTKLWGWY
jgi:hypothetical protein